ncbi:helix-turn-helix transcriptional regulator [Desulfosporosinus meridiei]|uniref:DNA-binding protein, excisionase family n=1 Tax=Desulfosporosinus meridiei (strain ATCC BAA-275 / DSM 13257 / KCTC 12902 / NCIMB 13706 / S10) TaxID=768704 RepID=J7IQM5_DESMD|nr:helix-turn-helix transcriptional regulator [Desulfosporosinus meridiei]AFQ42479.1 DNA-binding protein, excisionase family [Desulfosporosinus meridiei DSM 13257]
MSTDISYTPEEIAKILKISKFTVYELIKRGELTAYRIGRKVRVEGADLEAYKQKSKGLSTSTPPLDPSAINEELVHRHRLTSDESLVICGQDIVLDILTRYLEKQFPQVHFLRRYIGSIDGLMALYRGLANVVTAHLWDSDTNEYNTPYVRRLMPGHQTCVINLVYRMEGFYVAKGNPKNITTWGDLVKPEVRYVNRERGSGARVLLDEQLRISGIKRQDILGYGEEELTHLAVASKVARGEADVGLGIEKVAMQFANLDFIPLHKERYDLVMRLEDVERPHFQALISILRSSAFRNEVQGIGGYDISQMGEIIAEV